MPTRTKAPTKTKEYFRNAKTWKQISTNVPPEMLKALQERLTADYTMSHLLRDLIAESEVMRGGYPQPRWSVELSRELSELRREISDLRAMQAEGDKSEPETCVAEEEPAPESPISSELEEKEEAQIVADGRSDGASEKPKKTKPFAFLEKLEKLPEKLGFGRKSA